MAVSGDQKHKLNMGIVCCCFTQLHTMVRVSGSSCEVTRASTDLTAAILVK